jgi:hypothetical protein
MVNDFELLCGEPFGPRNRACSVDAQKFTAMSCGTPKARSKNEMPQKKQKDIEEDQMTSLGWARTTNLSIV